MIGQSISHYRVLEKLGEGGMGVVYKGEDLKLGRVVALKLLPSEGLNDPERKGRFLHEAWAAAAIDHPNICTVYEIDEADGRLFMAMPFLEGRTLDQRIGQGPLPIADAVEIALQLADALGEAHAKGIVHRDVKPPNVMLLERDDRPVQVKLMDFGLARLSEATKLTREGVQPGTVQYMSPEQVSGEKIDRRTDIWSLGVVLYEMIAGRLPFEGAYEQALYYGILNEQPEPLTALRTGVPVELERIALKCLAKRASERYQQTGELAVDLRLLGKTAGRREALHTQPKTSTRERFGRRDLVWAVGMAFAIALTLLASRDDAPPAARRPDLVPLTANAAELSVASAAISPDGRYLAYSDPTGLSLRQTDTGEARTLDLEGDFDPRHVSWFPDSTRLLFVSPDPEGQAREAFLWTVSALGGKPRRVADRAYVAYVSPDGSNIAFLQEQQASEIWLADAEGSNPRILYAAEDRVAIWALAWAPDSQAVAYGWSQPWPEQSRSLGGLTSVRL